jgi:protein-tyrosine phosphatase
LIEVQLFNSILVICTGNICRSPYGEAKLKQLLPDIHIDSAGVATEKNHLQGFPADPLAIEVANELGFDLTQHKAKQATQVLVDSHDLIIAMDRNQMEVLCEMFPNARSKSFLFGHWIGLSSIEDPYRKDKVAFRQAFSNIDKAAQSWAGKLA